MGYLIQIALVVSFALSSYAADVSEKMKPYSDRLLANLRAQKIPVKEIKVTSTPNKDVVVLEVVLEGGLKSVKYPFIPMINAPTDEKLKSWTDMAAVKFHLALVAQGIGIPGSKAHIYVNNLSSLPKWTWTQKNQLQLRLNELSDPKSKTYALECQKVQREVLSQLIDILKAEGNQPGEQAKIEAPPSELTAQYLNGLKTRLESMLAKQNFLETSWKDSVDGLEVKDGPLYEAGEKLVRNRIMIESVLGMIQEAQKGINALAAEGAQSPDQVLLKEHIGLLLSLQELLLKAVELKSKVDAKSEESVVEQTGELRTVLGRVHNVSQDLLKRGVQVSPDAVSLGLSAAVYDLILNLEKTPRPRPGASTDRYAEAVRQFENVERQVTRARNVAELRVKHLSEATVVNQHALEEAAKELEVVRELGKDLARVQIEGQFRTFKAR